MLRVSTGRFPANADVKNECGVTWGVSLTPLAPLDLNGKGSLRRRSSRKGTTGGFGSSSSPMASPSTSVVPPVSPSLMMPFSPSPGGAWQEARCRASEISRCTNCAAYISQVAKVVSTFWRCSLCGRRNNLSTRYTDTEDSIKLHSLPELAADVFEADADDMTSATKAAYVFIVDLHGDERTIAMYRRVLEDALDLLGEDDAVGLVVFGSTSVAVLDSSDGATDNPLFRRVSVNKSGECLAQWSTIMDPKDWLRSLDQRGKERILTGIRSLQRSMAVRGGAGSQRRSDTPCVLAAVRSTMSLFEAVRLQYSCMRCIITLCESYAFVDFGGVQTVARDAVAAGIMFDVAILDEQKKREDPCPPVFATVWPLTRTTGGTILMCADETSVRVNICHLLERPVALLGVMRIRMTPEFRVSQCFGSGITPDQEVEDIFRVCVQGTSHSVAFGFEFSGVDGFLGGFMPPCLQVAFKFIEMRVGYPTRNSLRVHTMQIPAVQSALKVRNESDASVVLSLLLHKAIAASNLVGAETARSLLEDWLLNLTSSGSQGKGLSRVEQAEAHFTKRMTRLIHGLTRSPVLSQEYLQSFWEKLPPDWLAIAAYPKLLALGGGREDESEFEGSPFRELPLSMSDIIDSGSALFILDAFTTIVLYLYTPAASVPAHSSFPPPDASTPMTLIRRLRRGRPITPQLLILRQSVPEEDIIFQRFLIDTPQKSHHVTSPNDLLVPVNNLQLYPLQSK